MLKRLFLAICCPLIILFPSFGFGQQVPQTREQIVYSFAPLVSQTSPAVVNIFVKTETPEQTFSPLFDDPFFRQFFGNMFPGQARRRTQQSLGSGVILDPQGLVVTNHHVVADATQVRVVLSDRREFEAEIVIDDERTDLTVLRIDNAKKPLPYIDMRDSDSVEVGDLVLAIGNPFGVGQTVTSGIVSALARTAIGITDYSFFIQTDASINPGNSGGALIAMDGKLIGINTAIFSHKGRGGGGSVGIGFAVPSNMVRTVLESARKGKLVRPWFGAKGQSVTADLAQEFGLGRPAGVIINKIFPGSPAEEAGFTIGDIVVALGGKSTDDKEALRYRIATLPVGKKTNVKIIRLGHRLELTLVLRPPSSKPAPEISDIKGRNPLSGARIANISPAFAIENGFNDMARGVVVVGKRRGSFADNIRLMKGDIIVKVNNRTIKTVRDVKRAVRKERKVWKLSVRRGDKILHTEISE